MKYPKDKRPIKFILIFVILFIIFYYFNIAFLSLTSHGNHYNAFIDGHFDYISGLRLLLINCSAAILSAMGYITKTNQDELMVVGHGIIKVAYSCLGLGVVSFLAAFIIAYPKPLKQKVVFLFSSIIVFELLNVIRLVLLALFWDKEKAQMIDHHTVFNVLIYIIIAVSLYFWMRANHPEKTGAKN